MNRNVEYTRGACLRKVGSGHVGFGVSVGCQHRCVYSEQFAVRVLGLEEKSGLKQEIGEVTSHRVIVKCRKWVGSLEGACR